MSDILQFLGVSAGSYVESGVIQETLGGGRYVVDIAGRDHTLRFAGADESGLVPGARVVINRTDTGRYIMAATQQLTSQTIQEIVING